MRVLLADDQGPVRSALRLLLEQAFSLHVIGEVTEGDMLQTDIAATQPDLVLLDWELPGLAADELLTTLRRRYPQMLVVVLSGRPEAEQAARAAGARVFISKGESPDRLLAELRALETRSEFNPAA